jgi:ATP-dependent exoDNAse (exonuclease V) alpha subunit
LRVAAGVAAGDKVMQIASDDEAEVCKGDVGTAKTIDTDASELTGY